MVNSCNQNAQSTLGSVRVWLPVTAAQYVEFFRAGTIQCDVGFAITPEWTLQQDDTDPEVLESDLLDLAGESDSALIVLVAELAASVRDPEQGQVVPAPVTRRNLAAVFARGDAQEDFSWFGPTESLSVLEFLGLQG